jgi:hypothetical protein
MCVGQCLERMEVFAVDDGMERFVVAALHFSGADKARVNVVLEFCHDDEVCVGYMLAFWFKGIE